MVRLYLAFRAMLRSTPGFKMLSSLATTSCMTRLQQLFIVNVVFLFFNMFIVIIHMDRQFWSMESYFQPNVSPDKRQLMLRTLTSFVNALDAANVTSYFLYGGSLIGSYRHHGPIPWDDDIDVIADTRDKERIFSALTKLSPHYGLYLYGPMWEKSQWKFYDNSSSAISYVHKGFKWPYVDLFFYENNSTHIWDEVWLYSRSFCWPKSLVFPLTRRPFSDLTAPVPCRTSEFLARNYDLSLCRSRGFNHLQELPSLQLTSKDVPCVRLRHLFPFVTSRVVTSDGSSVVETLSVSEWNVSTAHVSNHDLCSAL